MLILVVDFDNALTGEQGREQGQGQAEHWTVESFTRSRDAFFHYLKAPHTYDLVICNLTLAQKDGETFVYDVKRANPYQDIVVVAPAAASFQLPDSFGVKVCSKPVSLNHLLRDATAKQAA